MFRTVTRRLHNEPYKILLSKEETCFVVHHPDNEHPYEYTRPLPECKVEQASILKVDSKNMFTKSPNLEQLQVLTYTHHSHWHKFAGREKRRKYKEYFDDKVDRPGLTS